MATGYIWDERFAWHDAGRASRCAWTEPYPALDRPETKRRIASLVSASGLDRHLVPIAPRLATEDELARFHTREYIARVKALSDADGGDTGESAWIGPGGYDIARLAVGACIEAVDATLDGRVRNAYALVRPCGHHAEPHRGRGFGVFGNVVLAVLHAQAVRGVERIAVVDWDAHHGNGTQLAFYGDPSVLTISLHQERLYPVESGAETERGVGPGTGYNINVPMLPGSGHGAYIAAFDEIVLPAVEAFRPELIVVACGFDASFGDPLARLMCTSETYREMTRRLAILAGALCGGRLVFCHEGGYSPTYAPYCGLAVLEELSGVRTEVRDPMLGWYASVGGQELTSAQAERIGRIARRLVASPPFRAAA